MRTDKPRVLIVDDDLPLAQAYAWVFREWGWCPVKALEADQAIGLLCEPWQLIALDLMMPPPGGAAVLREVRRRELAIPVAVMTGATPEKASELLDDLKPDRLLFKPFIFEPMTDYARALFDAFYAPPPVVPTLPPPQID